MSSLSGSSAYGVSLSGLNSIDADSIQIGTILIDDNNISGVETIDATNVNSTNLIGTLQTASQTNITSVGEQSSGLTIGPSQSYKINVGPPAPINLLSFNTLGSSVVNSSLTSFGIVPTATITTLTSTDVNSTNLTGTLQTSSQPNITSLGTLPTATITTLTSTNVNSTNLTGTLQTASQPNITSVGTLTSLASGQITVAYTGDNAFYHNRTSNATYVKSFTGLCSALIDGQNVLLTLGKAQSTNNCAEIQHAYSTTPVNNRVALGFYGNGNLLTINQNGLTTATQGITFTNGNTIKGNKGSSTLANVNTHGTENTGDKPTFLMTASPQSGYTATASSTFSGLYPAYQGFGNTGGGWISVGFIYNPTTGAYVGSNYISACTDIPAKIYKAYFGEWLKLQLPSPISGIFSITMATNTDLPRITVLGSYNGTDYFYIFNFTTTSASSTTYTNSSPTTNAYSYIVLVITSLKPLPTVGFTTLSSVKINGNFRLFNELNYLPEVVEIGQSITTSIPTTNTLTVNGDTQLNGDLNLGKGFIEEYRKLFCHLEMTTTSTVNAGQSFFTNARANSTNGIDTTPFSLLASGYGYNFSGTYDGYYRAPYEGWYRFSISARFADGTASTTIGLMPKKFNGSTYTNILPNDGVLWGWRDNPTSNRNCISHTYTTYLTVGLAVYATPYSNISTTWAIADIEFITGTLPIPP